MGASDSRDWPDEGEPPATQDQDREVSQSSTHSVERACSLEEGLKVLRHSTDPLAKDLLQALEAGSRFALHLFDEHQQLRRRLQDLETQQQGLVAHLQAENQLLLQQAVQERKGSPEASWTWQATSPRSALWFPPLGGVRTPNRDFIVQFRVSGNTGGCERQILDSVSKLLSCQGVSLKAEKQTENPKHLLLVFCPIAHRIDPDIENALEGLKGAQKALLVVMHFVQKDNRGTFVDTRQQVTHPALVLTVHVCYSLQDGFYPCEINDTATATMAKTIQSLARLR